MAQAPQTIAGYPTAARVIQAPTATTRPATTYAGAPTVVAGAPIQAGAVVGQARTISSAPVTAGQPQVRTVGAPVQYQGAAPVIQGGAVTAGVRQAKVLSGGSVIQQGAVQPTIIQGARTVVPGATLAPQLLAPRPATVISSSEPRPNTLAGPTYTQGAYEAKHKDDPQLQNLKELRKSCGLKSVPVNDALQTLKARSIDAKLTRDQFAEAYSVLLEQHGVEAPSDEVKNAVFDLFDRDDNGVVDMMELICGVSLLCVGTEEDKIHAVFNVFDENGDGVISMDEMFKFLTSVFKVVLTPNVMAVMNTMGVTVESPEDLASVTALECFKTADLNHDGRLSVEEFKNWFFAPRNDPSFLFSPVRKLLQ